MQSGNETLHDSVTRKHSAALSDGKRGICTNFTLQCSNGADQTVVNHIQLAGRATDRRR